jgi:hypothetical protein
MLYTPILPRIELFFTYKLIAELKSDDFQSPEEYSFVRHFNKVLFLEVN